MKQSQIQRYGLSRYFIDINAWTQHQQLPFGLIAQFLDHCTVTGRSCWGRYRMLEKGCKIKSGKQFPVGSLLASHPPRKCFKIEVLGNKISGILRPSLDLPKSWVKIPQGCGFFFRLYSRLKRLHKQWWSLACFKIMHQRKIVVKILSFLCFSHTLSFGWYFALVF